ncbi:ENTH domain-containing protein C794.11c [Malania oleifera]|uniref:ENTH domain-containing protein C794.11c n=1 Tax=Malania oleifera TaxID=397392 RepID=UPI0025AE792A|nr:ENTH domain-containing protein C794.11c [Malania oleifera]
MSILSKSSSSGNMGTPFFHELKKQASFFLKEKIKTARLALTDVTPAELLTEEATNGNPWSPDTRTMGLISRAAFELDDYWRIVEILHKKLLKFDRKNWRTSHKALVVLEHLLTHGPESVAEEFQSDEDVIRQMGNFQHIDEKGFNWGLTVRKKSERILMLLEQGPLLKEERDRARKLTRGIQGFGSFSHTSYSAQAVLQEASVGAYERSNSHFNNHGNQENQSPSLTDGGSIKTSIERSESSHEDAVLVSGKIMGNSNSSNGFYNGELLGKSKTQTSFKENMAPKEELLREGELHQWDCLGEPKPLLGGEKNEPGTPIAYEDHHPFKDNDSLTTASLLYVGDETSKRY